MKIRPLLLGLLVAAPVHAFDYDDYSRALAKGCAARHLEFLPPGDLADYLDGFAASLPAADRDRLLKTADIEHACGETEAGASCQNFAQIEAAHKLKLLPRLVDSLCARPLACTAQSACGPRL